MAPVRSLVLVLAAAVVGYSVGLLHAPRCEARSGRRDHVAAEAQRAAGVHRPPGAAAEHPQVREEEIARSLVEAVGCPETTSGAGRITGVVLDEEKLPVAGVTVAALPQDFPGADPYSASPVARYASWRKWESASRREATTGVDGRYEIHGLGSVLYRLRAERHGYRFSGWRWNVYPGAVVNLAASRVVELDVVILLPGGEVAPFAWLDRTQPALRISRIWSPRGERCEVAPGTWTLKASHPLRETLASDPVEVVATWGEPLGPIVLRLEEKPGIRGTLLSWSGDVPHGARIYLLPERDGVPPEPGALWTADENGGRKVDLGDAARGTFGFFDLSPGVYWVAAAVPDGEMEACTRVPVGAGISEVRLEISGRPRPPPSLEILDDVGDG